MIRNRHWSPLQFITNGNSIEQILWGAQMALESGCKWIQLRMKDFRSLEVEAAAIVLKPLCRQYNAVLIIDDDVAMAKKMGLDGVHLGLNDMPISQAREILGDGFIIGGTANTAEQAQHQIDAGADYLGIGPFRFTETKKNLSPILGLEGYKSVMAQLGNKTPVVAIGGIEIADIKDIMATGVDGIAISGTILKAKNPIETTEKILETLK